MNVEQTYVKMFMLQMSIILYQSSHCGVFKLYALPYPAAKMLKIKGFN